MRMGKHVFFKRSAWALAASSMISACSFAPTYQKPATAIPTVFKESGPWQAARPADQIPQDGWWRAFHDPRLNALEPRVAAANPDLAAAVAVHDEATAFLSRAQSGLYPQIGLNDQNERIRQSNNRPLRNHAVESSVYDSATLEVGASYDLDLWGRIRNQVSASRDEAQASSSDVQAVRLSLQTSVATAYFSLIGLDQQADFLNQTIDAYQRALKLTESRHAGGLASDLDVSRAQTQLASAHAALDDIAARRALFEHAIATLTGVPASNFTLPPMPGALNNTRSTIPQIPTGMPAALLQRRPDIAAAERRVAESNAQIGIAKAAFFPDISLGLDGGFQSDTYSPWLAAPNEIWSLGPQLAMSLFDGGKREAMVRKAQANLDENGAKYKSVVLKAFQQVEDQLSNLHHLGDEAQSENDALKAAQRTLQLSMSRYRDGAVDYLNVVTAQATELQVQIAALNLDTRRLQSSVELIEALGGGWAPGNAAAKPAKGSATAPTMTPTPTPTASATSVASVASVASTVAEASVASMASSPGATGAR